MKNKLTDLNDHLFAQIERLGDEDLSAEDLKNEIERSKAITSVSNQIVGNAALALAAEKFKFENRGINSTPSLPKMIEG